MGKRTIYHGSPVIVEKPELSKGKPYNDYGRGFYCTAFRDLAAEWSCTENADGFVNRYELETDDLAVLDLNSNDYSILHWLAVLIEHRKVRLNTAVMRRGAAWLREHYSVSLDDYDIVKGYRADDSYFAFARAFLGNEISYEQLSRAMRLGELGEQIVLRSERSFGRLAFIGAEHTDAAAYYPLRQARDSAAREAYERAALRDDISGLYIRELILGEVGPDDPRVR